MAIICRTIREVFTATEMNHFVNVLNKIRMNLPLEQKSKISMLTQHDYVSDKKTGFRDNKEIILHPNRTENII